MTDLARSHVFSLFLASAFAALLAGCMTRAPAPVIERAPVPAGRPAPPPEAGPARAAPEAPPTYTVKRGDTLYQIALDHGLDYRELAACNNIDNVNVIRVGQVLALAAPGTTTEGGVVTSPLVTAPPVVPSGGEARPPPSPVPSSRPNSATFKAEPRAVTVPASDRGLAQLRQS